MNSVYLPSNFFITLTSNQNNLLEQIRLKFNKKLHTNLIKTWGKTWGNLMQHSVLINCSVLLIGNTLCPSAMKQYKSQGKNDAWALNAMVSEQFTWKSYTVKIIADERVNYDPNGLSFDKRKWKLLRTKTRLTL